MTTPVRALPPGARALLIVSLLAATVLADACDRGGGVNRDDAIDQAIEQSGGTITLDQASCYVDRVLDELGASALRSDADVPPEQVARLTTIRVDCIGVANLGTSVPTPTGTDAEAGIDDTPPIGAGLPQRRGDDAEFDALWDRCAQGYGDACDQLFDAAPLDSDYERFASSCGDRTRELRCADIYPSPGVTLPSPAQASTTEPPTAP